MISRIRVEARAASMDEAQREIEIVLRHASLAALLEGVAATGGSYTDSHFGEKYGNDAWNQNNLRFEGRMALTLDPSFDPGGGLRQYSYRVVRDDSDQITDPNLLPADNGRDVTDEVFVLERARPVTRENTWDGMMVLHEEGDEKSGVADAEAVLDNIRRLVNVRDLVVQPVVGGWNVSVVTDQGAHDETDPVLREAALRAYGKCGVAVTHFETVGGAARTQS